MEANGSERWKSLLTSYPPGEVEMLERKGGAGNRTFAWRGNVHERPKGPVGVLSIGRDMLEIADCIASSGPYNGLRESGVPEPELFEFVLHT